MSLLADWWIYFRHIRIFGYASPEVVLTFLLAYWCSYYFSDDVSLKSTVMWFFGIVALTVPIHYYYGVHTELLYQLGLSACPPDLNSLTGIFQCPK